jgi:MFS family permease
MGASAALSQFVPWYWTDVSRWQGLAISATLGALLMIVATLPLAAMPAFNRSASAAPREPWRSLLQAVRESRYRRLLAAYGWIGIVNGLTQTPHELYSINVLRLPYSGRLFLLGLMRAGQSAIAPLAGRWTDRFGNRPVMIVAQLIAAAGSLLLLAARPEFLWPLLGAYLAWIAYAGLNVGLDNIKLKLAPHDNNAPFLAVYHALGDLAGATALAAGGYLFDAAFQRTAGTAPIFAAFLIGSWIARTSAVLLLGRLIEPGARRLSAG